MHVTTRQPPIYHPLPDPSSIMFLSYYLRIVRPSRTDRSVVFRIGGRLFIPLTYSLDIFPVTILTCAALNTIAFLSHSFLRCCVCSPTLSHRSPSYIRSTIGRRRPYLRRSIFSVLISTTRLPSISRRRYSLEIFPITILTRVALSTIAFFSHSSCVVACVLLRHSHRSPSHIRSTIGRTTRI